MKDFELKEKLEKIIEDAPQETVISERTDFLIDRLPDNSPPPAKTNFFKKRQFLTYFSCIAVVLIVLGACLPYFLSPGKIDNAVNLSVNRQQVKSVEDKISLALIEYSLLPKETADDETDPDEAGSTAGNEGSADAAPSVTFSGGIVFNMYIGRGEFLHPLGDKISVIVAKFTTGEETYGLNQIIIFKGSNQFYKMFGKDNFFDRIKLIDSPDSSGKVTLYLNDKPSASSLNAVFNSKETFYSIYDITALKETSVHNI